MPMKMPMLQQPNQQPDHLQQPPLQQPIQKSDHLQQQPPLQQQSMPHRQQNQHPDPHQEQPPYGNSYLNHTYDYQYGHQYHQVDDFGQYPTKEKQLVPYQTPTKQQRGIDDDFKTYVKRSLETLKFQMRELTTLVESNAATVRSQSKESYDIPGFSFPLVTSEQVRELELHLSANEEAKKSLLTFFSFAAGGDVIGPFVNRILSRLITNKVGNSFTWTGKSKNNCKAKFANLKNIFSIISQAVRGVPKFKDCPDKSIEDAIRNWLRHANERVDDGANAEEDPETEESLN